MKDEKYSGSDFYCDLAIAGKLDLEKEYESDVVLAYHHAKPILASTYRSCSEATHRIIDDA